jgi:2-phosphosulfolactate phosphatase
MLPAMMQEATFNQHPHRLRLEWGRRGVREAAERGDVVVIVDVLRFSSCVAAAASRGASVYPCAWAAEADELAKRIDGYVARAPGSPTRFALVPTFSDAAAEDRIVLRTLNGAECTVLASAAPRVFAGSLLNAAAVGATISTIIASSDMCVTVVACGERLTKPAPDDEEMRFAIEDYLGAGAILSATGGDLSPEAEVCAAAFAGSRDRLPELLMECASGRQLREWALEDDVRFAARLDACGVVAELHESHYEASRTDARFE